MNHKKGVNDFEKYMYNLKNLTWTLKKNRK